MTPERFHAKLPSRDVGASRRRFLRQCLSFGLGMTASMEMEAQQAAAQTPAPPADNTARDQATMSRKPSKDKSLLARARLKATSI